MNITRDKGKIFVNGGGILRICKISEDETYTSGDYFKDLGYIQDFELKDDTTTEDIVDETGDLIKSVNGNRIVTLNATLKQVSKDTFDFFSNYSDEIVNKYFTVYRLNTKGTAPEGDVWVEQWFGICQIKPMVNVKYPQPSLPIEIKVLKNNGAIAIATADRFSGYTPKVGGSATITIPAGKFYYTSDTTVS